MHTVFHPLFGTTRYLEDPAAVERSKQYARTRLRGKFERIDAQLDGRDWLTGLRSVVDPGLFVILRWAEGLHRPVGAGQRGAFSTASAPIRRLRRRWPPKA